jgi:hypothetical protein
LALRPVRSRGALPLKIKHGRNVSCDSRANAQMSSVFQSAIRFGRSYEPTFAKISASVRRM